MNKLTQGIWAKIGFFSVLILLILTLWMIFIWREDVSNLSQVTPTVIPTVEITPTNIPTVDPNGPTVTPSAAPTLIPTEEPTPTPSLFVEPTKEVVMRMYEYSFDPAVIKVSGGEKLRIQLSNEGEETHRFVIDELDYDSGLLAPGEKITIDLIVPVNEQARYFYYCDENNYRDLGMEGYIDVSQ